MLSSEKYIGDVLMQKTFTPDALGGLQVKNIGQQVMYLIENDHEAIVNREIWIRVQEMKSVPLPDYMRIDLREVVQQVLRQDLNRSMGRNFRNRLEISTRNMLPKFPPEAILMYLITFEPNDRNRKSTGRENISSEI